MSVIRRGTRRSGYGGRLARTVGSIATAAIEVTAVGTWLALLTWWERTASIALLALAVLLAGTTLRRFVADQLLHRGRPANRSLALFTMAVFESACWVSWLLVVEWLGGAVGLVAGATVLGVGLLASHGVEALIDAVAGSPFHVPVPPGLAGVTIARVVGGSVLLVAFSVDGWPWGLDAISPAILDHVVIATLAVAVVLTYARYRRAAARGYTRVE